MEIPFSKMHMVLGGAVAEKKENRSPTPGKWPPLGPIVYWASRFMVWSNQLSLLGFCRGVWAYKTPGGIVDWTKPRPRIEPLHLGVKICHCRCLGRMIWPRRF